MVGGVLYVLKYNKYTKKHLTYNGVKFHDSRFYEDTTVILKKVRGQVFNYFYYDFYSAHRIELCTVTHHPFMLLYNKIQERLYKICKIFFDA